MALRDNVLREARLILSEGRRGKGPWMLWFPEKTHQYISGSIRTKSELQALGAWLASESGGRDWHNSIFRDHKEVKYRGRVYTKEQGKLLYHSVVKNNDWGSVDRGIEIKL
jgi:hypothetical protein